MPRPAVAVGRALPLRGACRSSRLLALLLMLTGLIGPCSYAQTVALTFDDGFDSTSEQAASDNTAVLAALKRHRIRAMLFPAGFLADIPQNMTLVQAWSQAGHAIGNHTYSHEALSKTDTARYIDDILHAQALLHALPGWCPRLRFPYLDEGGSGPQYHQAMQSLAHAGYGIAPVTIAMPDWELTQRYEAILAGGSAADAQAFRRSYLDQVWQQAQTQEAHWRTLLGRSPAHVLLLHTNRLNAAVLPELLKLFERNGWSFTDATAALQDPIYQRSYNQADGTVATLPNPACR